MSLARQPRDDDAERQRPTAVSTLGTAEFSIANGAAHGSPARGVVWGLALSLAGFWLPLAAIAGRLALK